MTEGFTQGELELLDKLFDAHDVIDALEEHIENLEQLVEKHGQSKMLLQGLALRAQHTAKKANRLARQQRHELEGLRETNELRRKQLEQAQQDYHDGLAEQELRLEFGREP